MNMSNKSLKPLEMFQAMWIVLRFVLLVTELSVVTFGFFFGNFSEVIVNCYKIH